MPVEKIGRGWRARRKKGDKTFNGRIRDTEAAANEDAQQLEEAAAESIERLKEVHARLQHGAGRVLPAPSVVQHGAVWRVRVSIGKDKISGPTRQSKTEAENERLSPSHRIGENVSSRNAKLGCSFAPGGCRDWRRS